MTAGRQSGVLRTAGLPIRIWLAAAAPQLFALVRQLDRADSRYRLRAAELADRLGAEIVPSAELRTDDRRWVLALRRALHQGMPVSSDDCRRLEKLTSLTPDLAAGLEEAERLAAEVRLLADAATGGVDEERQRLAAAPWELLRSMPAGRRLLDDRSLAPMADIARRVTGGEPWTTKRMRQRSDYLWRMIGRGAAKTTPRGWLGHVSLVTVTDDLADRATDPVAVSAQTATEWMENLHLARASAMTSQGLGPGSWLSLTPLQCDDGGRRQIWVLDPADPARLVTWRLRRSAGLQAVTSALEAGPAPLAELEARAFGDLDDQRRATIRAFLARLAEMGVLQVSAPPRQLRQGWQEITRPRPCAGFAGAAAGSGYTDVYRQASGRPAVSFGDLRDAVEQVLRLRALMLCDGPAAEPGRPGPIGPDPRPVLEVFAEKHAARRTATGRAPGGPHLHGTWPRTTTPRSGYARLLTAMAQAADTPAALAADGAVNITADLLDAAGAPDRPVSWPVDCVTRPLGQGRCVLHDSAPAAVLDARFIEMLEWLNGPAPQADAYRGFLAELDQRTGIRSVELLVPPVSEQAANAVRLPLYAGAWTGDSDPAMYSAGGREAGQVMDYLPLAALTVRRDGGQVIVEHKGRQVRVLSHATRNPRYPWNLMAGLLLAGSPQRGLRACRLRWSLAAYPDRSFFPKITVAGSVVICAAQWLVRAAELWDADAPQLARLRHLLRLRDCRELPRWVFVARWPGARPVPCDLESLRALQVFEQASAGAGDLLVEEMLPRPADLSVTDLSVTDLSVTDLSGTPGGLVASELMIRLGAAVTAAADREANSSGETSGRR